MFLNKTERITQYFLKYTLRFIITLFFFLFDNFKNLNIASIESYGCLNSHSLKGCFQFKILTFYIFFNCLIINFITIYHPVCSPRASISIQEGVQTKLVTDAWWLSARVGRPYVTATLSDLL